MMEDEELEELFFNKLRNKFKNAVNKVKAAPGNAWKAFQKIGDEEELEFDFEDEELEELFLKKLRNKFRKKFREKEVQKEVQKEVRP